MTEAATALRVPNSIPRRILTSLQRVGRLACIAAAVAASLLAFPAWTVAMVGIWLAWYSARMLKGGKTWFPLAACVAIVAVKQVVWLPTLALLMCGMLLAVLVDRRWQWKTANHQRRARLALVAALWAAWAGFAWDWRRSAEANHSVAPLDQRPIVCIGDSLTSYPPRRGYPHVLGRMLKVPVVNLGQPGVTTAEALAQLPALVAARPQAVVIELGGHDYLKDSSWLPTSSRARVKRNLERLIGAAQDAGAEVILMEIPRGFVIDPYAGLERELARKYDLQLISDTAIRQLVLWSPYCPPGLWTGGPYLSDDGLHPNARGDEYLASTVAQTLARLYGPQILERAQ